jgi:hypothetical protein
MSRVMVALLRSTVLPLALRCRKESIRGKIRRIKGPNKYIIDQPARPMDQISLRLLSYIGILYCLKFYDIALLYFHACASPRLLVT